MEELIKITMSGLDYELIRRVKELREAHHLSQVQLSHRMELASGFVGKVELLTAPDKYSIRHLGLLAKAFGLKSLNELFPAVLPKEDLVTLTLRVTYNQKKDGSPSKKKLIEVIEVVSLKPGETRSKVS